MQWCLICFWYLIILQHFCYFSNIYSCHTTLSDKNWKCLISCSARPLWITIKNYPHFSSESFLVISEFHFLPCYSFTISNSLYVLHVIFIFWGFKVRVCLVMLSSVFLRIFQIYVPALRMIVTPAEWFTDTYTLPTETWNLQICNETAVKGNAVGKKINKSIIAYVVKSCCRKKCTGSLPLRNE